MEYWLYDVCMQIVESLKCLPWKIITVTKTNNKKLTKTRQKIYWNKKKQVCFKKMVLQGLIEDVQVWTDIQVRTVAINPW